MTVFKAPKYIKDLFNQIAYKYDFMNNLMSFGTHKFIKRECIKMLNIQTHCKVLDACCGTGDLANFAKTIQPLSEVTGADFSENMLAIAKNKFNNIKFIQTDITHLPFSDKEFDFVTMGFGLRNISNPEQALTEIYRILKPGGKFLHLDFGKKNFAGKMFDILTPILAKFFYGNSEPYRYLIKSKKEFPEPDELIKDFEKCGFSFKLSKEFIFGAISAQIMKK